MESTDSKIYPGIAREPGTFGTPDPDDPGQADRHHQPPGALHAAGGGVCPQAVRPRTAAPFIVGADGPDRSLFTALDNLIHQKRVPVMVAISIGNGSGDAQGSQRGLEYDTMSGLYAEFVEKEVLPLVEKQCNVKLTKDPEGPRDDGRQLRRLGGADHGVVSPGVVSPRADLLGHVREPAVALQPRDSARRVGLPRAPHPQQPAKPLRIWMEVGDRDNYNPNIMRDNMHDWVLANEHMAKVLADKGYHYQFVFAKNAGHTDGAVKQQTLPEALEYVWQGYPIDGEEVTRTRSDRFSACS